MGRDVSNRERMAWEHCDGRGREVSSLDWTLAQHERERQCYWVKKNYDYVQERYGWFQMVGTATLANHTHVNGLAVKVQPPS